MFINSTNNVQYGSAHYPWMSPVVPYPQISKNNKKYLQNKKEADEKKLKEIEIQKALQQQLISKELNELRKKQKELDELKKKEEKEKQDAAEKALKEKKLYEARIKSLKDSFEKKKASENIAKKTIDIEKKKELREIPSKQYRTDETKYATDILVHIPSFPTTISDSLLAFIFSKQGWVVNGLNEYKSNYEELELFKLLGGGLNYNKSLLVTKYSTENDNIILVKGPTSRIKQCLIGLTGSQASNNFRSKWDKLLFDIEDNRRKNPFARVLHFENSHDSSICCEINNDYEDYIKKGKSENFAKKKIGLIDSSALDINSLPLKCDTKNSLCILELNRIILENYFM